MDRRNIRIRFGQLNLQGSEAATAELPVVARTFGVDIVLVQEQYHSRPGILQCGESPKAGILALNSSIAVTVLTQLSNEYCIVAHLAHEDFGLHIISAYFQYCHDIGRHISHLESVLRRLPSSPIIIGVDSNAHSPLWYCDRRQYVGRGPDTDYRRNQMEGFILGLDLQLHNVPDQPPTFCGPNGVSNVDLTISTRGVHVCEWLVHEGASLSDHQLITFNVCDTSSGPARRKLDTVPAPFRVRGVNWPAFCSKLHARMDKLHPGLSATVYSERYSELLLRTAKESLGYCGRKDNGKYEWWTPALDELRRRTNKARRDWQKSKRTNSSNLETLHEELRALRGRYKSAMRTAEIDFFRLIAESGNDDPWGLAYREASGRSRPPQHILYGAKLSENYATSTGATMRCLLDTLYPDDIPTRDTPYHREIRIAAAFAPSGTCDMPAPDKSTVGRIVRALPKTAPGMDGLTSVIIKWAWKCTADEMTLMYTKCITDGVFPDHWKAGRLIVLPKGNGKPLSDPKAYRPITLLPILGKILERIIVACAPCLSCNISDSQHGFTKGRSTVTALSALNRVVEQSRAAYVQLIFLDISGAFDNAWWPMILLKVKQGGAPPNLYRILVSYFTNRRVCFVAGNQTTWKTNTMGCPQGSVLGPTLWNLLLNDLLLLPRPEGVHLIAYADDVTIAIEASSRAEIERNAATMLERITEWGARNRLGFSPGKSLTLTYKGKFKRAPTIRLSGAPVASVSQARLLGVTLDDARSYVPHASIIGEKSSNCFGKMSRVSATRWGVKYHALRVLYSGTYVATLTYAAAVWYRRSSNFVVKRTLLRTQRPALILLTKAYRSCSTAALPVLAGVLPADLEICRAGRIAEEGPQLVRKELRALKSNIRRETVALWQERWQASEDGRELYSFFPDVAVRLESEWIQPDHFVSQILTGHGCFRKRLHKMKLCGSPVCPCGEEEESRDHALWECSLYAEERSRMLDAIRVAETGPVYHQTLVGSRENFDALRTFAHNWHTIRRSVDDQQV